MAGSTLLCPTCGQRSSSGERFCLGCGSLMTPSRHPGIVPPARTQFSLPDYLLADRSRAARGRPSPFAVEEPGPGLAIAGAAMVATVLAVGRLSGLGLVWLAAGLLAALAGLWRLRKQAALLERAGWATAAAGAVAVAAVVAQGLDAMPAGFPFTASRPLAENAGAEPTPAPAALVVPSGRDVLMDRGNPARTGQNPGPGPEPPVGLRWRAFTGGDLFSSPAVAGGKVFVGAQGGLLAAYDAATGNPVWTFDLGGYVSRSAPAVDGDTVYVASGFALAAVSAADGTLRWRAPIRFAGAASPLVAGGTVYLPTQEGSLYAFDAATGEQRWHRKTEGLVFGSVALAGGRLYYGNEDGAAMAVDAGTGREVWRQPVPGAVRSTPAVSGGEAIFVTDAPATVALDVRTGEERWRAPFGGSASPAVLNGVVYVAADSGGLQALSQRQGAHAWTMSTGGVARGSPTVAGGMVYAPGGRSLHAVVAATGEPAWSFPVGGEVSGSPAVTGGVVYFGSRDGYLYALAAAIAGDAGTP